VISTRAPPNSCFHSRFPTHVRKSNRGGSTDHSQPVDRSARSRGWTVSFQVGSLGVSSESLRRARAGLSRDSTDADRMPARPATRTLGPRVLHGDGAPAARSRAS
jgi:hypothetical protein